jgi:hypothetical protein
MMTGEVRVSTVERRPDADLDTLVRRQISYLCMLQEKDCRLGTTAPVDISLTFMSRPNVQISKTHRNNSTPRLLAHLGPLRTIKIKQ